MGVKTKYLFLVSFFIIIIALMTVSAQPLMPNQFYGIATFDGSASEGIEVEAYYDGSVIKTTFSQSGGFYNLKVGDPDELKESETITFYLNGINTDQTAVFDNGASTKLDLSVTGSTPPPDNGGGGGSGGGGGGGGGGPSPSGSFYEEPVQPLNLGSNILQKGVSYIFSFYNKGHKIELTETGDDYVWITIYSEEQKIELKIGETKEVDLDNDGIPDVSFGLTSLSSAGKAGIEFKTIIKEGDGEIISEENEEETTGITGGVIANLFSSSSKIGTIILSLLILSGLIYFFVYKNKDKKKTIIKNIKKRIKKR